MKIAKTAVVATVLAIGAPLGASAEGDPAKGERVFKKCKACHQVGDDAKNRSGPTLNGIIGQPAGQNPDFDYSKALVDAAAEGLIWTEEELAAFLKKPRAYMDGTKMSFAGLRKDKDIANVIAYLAQFPPPQEPASE